ncbi:AT-rich interactive domain-containing protein 2 [Acorus gramineus]|uniref:AT-rich interactive domain-containing protein 2 n=1 Tax=Acorus gramineus TaxID=55184 RepID=A0AAV9BCP4_ACOGR|nr:AT-rich interactive domain-containing protein 2 [Acorus gramineus]
MVFKHNKRSYQDDETYQLGHKHPRQEDYICHLSSFDEILPFGEIPGKLNFSGEESFHASHYEDRFVNNNRSELPPVAAQKILVNDASCVMHEVMPNITQEDVRLERPTISPDHQVGVQFQWGPIESRHRKFVPIGPDHQVDIPEWVPHADDATNMFLETPVVPMSDTLSKDTSDIGLGGKDCGCLDEGSIRCVRQHISEAKGELMRTLGLERFRDLGFFDMGEGVSERWTEEEEHAFHEVVFSNPVSMGKNFWDYLVLVFPSRSYRELVSYYFNVFMLQKRARQNRIVSLNIDSDDDEWQQSDQNEILASEDDDDDDSVVESPHDSDLDDDCDHSIDIDDNDDDECTLYHVTEGQGKKNIQDGGEDDSCTSYETEHQGSDCLDPADKDHKRFHGGESRNNALSGEPEHEYVLGPCDLREWDVDYMCLQKVEMDFLPTYNMIEEVFGKGAWDDDKGC